MFAPVAADDAAGGVPFNYPATSPTTAAGVLALVWLQLSFAGMTVVVELEAASGIVPDPGAAATGDWYATDLITANRASVVNPPPLVDIIRSDETGPFNVQHRLELLPPKVCVVFLGSGLAPATQYAASIRGRLRPRYALPARGRR